MDLEKLRYAESHEWVHLEGGVATVGITDFAVEQLTDLVFIELPEVGRQVSAGEAFGEIESVKAVSDLYSPVDGEVVEVNGDLADNLERLSSDPFGTGWMIKVKLAEGAGVDHLMDRNAYQKQIAEEGS